jgi:flagellar hook-length control protein FliK
VGRVLHSVIGAKGSRFVNLEQNSAQFVMPTTLHFSSNYNISSKHKTSNGFNTEKDALANDILRNADMVKFSAIDDLNARNLNDNKFDKSISVDAPRTYKLDMSLNTWQKVFGSQVSKAALDNITKLQFTINPKKLGRVSVTLQMDAGNVNVSIFSSNGHVANILQTSEGKLEALLSDHGMKLASYNVSSEQNGQDKRDRAPTNGRHSEIVERNGSKTADVVQSEAKSRTSTSHNGDYDYLV